MSLQVRITAPTRQARVRQSCRQTKLQIDCQKAFRPLKYLFSGIKIATSPIESGASSSEVVSIVHTPAAASDATRGASRGMIS